MGYRGGSSAGGMSGSLVAGKIPKATGSSALADSNLLDTGALLVGNAPLALRSVDQLLFSSSAADASVAADCGIGRAAAGIAKLTDGAAGKGWLSNRLGHVRKTTDQPIFSSIVLTDLADLSVNLLAGRNYQFRGVLFVNNAISASGIRAALQGTAIFSDLRYTIEIWDLGTRALTAVSTLSVLGTAVIKATIASGDHRVVIEGSCSVTTGGTLKAQGAQGTSDASNTTFKRGSYLHVEDVT